MSTSTMFPYTHWRYSSNQHEENSANLCIRILLKELWIEGQYWNA